MDKKNNKQYVVYKGRNPGTYESWQEAKQQVTGYPGNCYEKAQPSGEPRIKPYVVYQGPQPGVYDSWRQTHDQVSGYPGASFERAKNFDEANNKFHDFMSTQGSSSSTKKENWF